MDAKFCLLIVSAFALEGVPSLSAEEINEKDHPACKQHIRYWKLPAQRRVTTDDCRPHTVEFNELAKVALEDCLKISNQTKSADASYERIESEGFQEAEALSAKLAGQGSQSEMLKKAQEANEIQLRNFQAKQDLIFETREQLVSMHKELQHLEKRYDKYVEFSLSQGPHNDAVLRECPNNSRKFFYGYAVALAQEIISQRKNVAEKVHALNERMQKNYLIIGASKKQAIELAAASRAMSSDGGSGISINSHGGTEGAERGIGDKVRDFLGVSRKGPGEEAEWRSTGKDEGGNSRYDRVAIYDSQKLDDDILKSLRPGALKAAPDQKAKAETGAQAALEGILKPVSNEKPTTMAQTGTAVAPKVALNDRSTGLEASLQKIEAEKIAKENASDREDYKKIVDSSGLYKQRDDATPALRPRPMPLDSPKEQPQRDWTKSEASSADVEKVVTSDRDTNAARNAEQNAAREAKWKEFEKQTAAEKTSDLTEKLVSREEGEREPASSMKNSWKPIPEGNDYLKALEKSDQERMAAFKACEDAGRSDCGSAAIGRSKSRGITIPSQQKPAASPQIDATAAMNECNEYARQGETVDALRCYRRHGLNPPAPARK